MKTLDEKAVAFEEENGRRIYVQSMGNLPDTNLCRESFKAGYIAAHEFTLVEEELPPHAEQLLLKVGNKSTPILGYYLRHKYREDAFYSITKSDISCILSNVVSWRLVEIS